MYVLHNERGINSGIDTGMGDGWRQSLLVPSVRASFSLSLFVSIAPVRGPPQSVGKPVPLGPYRKPSHMLLGYLEQHQHPRNKKPIPCKN